MSKAVFYSEYEWEILQGLPANREILQFYSVARINYGQGLVIKVKSKKGLTWSGNFQFGDGIGLTGVYSLPHPNMLCVIAKGLGYLVPVDNPNEYQMLHASSVQEVIYTPARNLVIFVTSINLVAYGFHGLVWETPRFTFEGINITEVTSETINGIVPYHRGDVPFSVDLETGKLEGGVQF